MTNLNAKPAEANTNTITTPATPIQTGPRSEAGKAISSKNAMKCFAPQTPTGGPETNTAAAPRIP